LCARRAVLWSLPSYAGDQLRSSQRSHRHHEEGLGLDSPGRAAGAAEGRGRGWCGSHQEEPGGKRAGGGSHAEARLDGAPCHPCGRGRVARAGGGSLPEDPRKHGSAGRVRRGSATGSGIPSFSGRGRPRRLRRRTAMSSVAALPTPQMLVRESQQKQEPKWRRYLHGGEDAVVALAFAALIVLPLAETVLRKTLGLGISGSTSLVQHFTLVLGMLGGAIAAREKRLLPLSTLGTLLKGRMKTAASVFSGSCSAAISALLCVASVQFVMFEKDAGKILVYGV